MNPTVWKMWECERGSRWTTVGARVEEGPCNFSGCDPANHGIRLVVATESVTEAHAWFRRPENLSAKSRPRAIL